MIPIPESLSSIVQYLMKVELRTQTVQNILPVGHPVLLLFPGATDSYLSYLQPTCAHMGITQHAERAILVGQLTCSVPVLPQIGMPLIGVHFHPTFFGRTQLTPIIDNFVNLSELLSDNLISKLNAILNHPTPHPIDPIIDFLSQWLQPLYSKSPQNTAFENLLKQWTHLHGIVDIESSAIQNGFSLRSLQRLMRSQTGYTPKQYNKLLRQHFILELANNPKQTLKKAAELADYFDHSHFIKDFKSLTGITPKEFMQSAQMSRALSASNHCSKI